ncbi:hypothetical protein H0H93_008228 [Arthromyces matolae]|nr:hypothetical protein H0H93_008228 [Arthromyces matolae]
MPGLTNEEKSSDEEILQRRALLLTLGQATSANTFNTSENRLLEGHSEHVSKPHVALERIPPEVLQQIFRYLAPFHSSYYNELPPPEEACWAIGQVCNLWRNISRDTPEIWGETILSGDKLLDLIKQATTLLPRAAVLSLVVEPGIQPLAKDAIFPYFPHVHKLKWARGGENHYLELFNALASQPAEHLSEFELYVESKPEDVGIPSFTTTLLSHAWCLTSLLLFSVSLDILMLKFPWDRLESLTIILEIPSTTLQDEMESFLPDAQHWFTKNSRLNTFTLVTSENVLLFLLEQNFPWDRLKVLTCSCESQTAFNRIAGVLSGHTPMLAIGLCFGHGNEISSFIDPVGILPSARCAIFTSTVYMPFLRPSYLCDQTKELILLTAIFQDAVFLEMVALCSNLRFLFLCNVQVEHSLQGPRNSKALTSLRSLVIQVDSDEDDGFPCLNLFTAPELSHLIIGAPSLMDALPLAHFIQKSLCAIDLFEWGTRDRQHQPTTPPGLRELVEGLVSVNVFDAPVILVPDEILQDIATKALLPAVDTLAFASSNITAFLKMVERRLEIEMSLGWVKLQDIVCYSGEEPDAQERARFKELSDRYAVCCSYRPFGRITFNRLKIDA